MRRASVGGTGTGGHGDGDGLGHGHHDQEGGGEETETASAGWQGEHRVVYYRPLLLVSMAVCTCFSAGYQAVAIAGWLQYFLLLRFLEWDRRRLRHWLAAWLVRAVGYLLALAGSLNDPGWNASGPVAVAVAALVIAALEVLCALVYITMGASFGCWMKMGDRPSVRPSVRQNQRGLLLCSVKWHTTD